MKRFKSALTFMLAGYFLLASSEVVDSRDSKNSLEKNTQNQLALNRKTPFKSPLENMTSEQWDDLANESRFFKGFPNKAEGIYVFLYKTKDNRLIGEAYKIREIDDSEEENPGYFFSFKPYLYFYDFDGDGIINGFKGEILIDDMCDDINGNERLGVPKEKIFL